MPLSRLRLRLSAAFALAFALGVAILLGALFLLLRRESDRQLTHRLQESAIAVADALAREYREAPRGGLTAAARETFRELPPSPHSYVVYDGAGIRIAAHGAAASLEAAPSEWRPGDPDVIDRTGAPENDVRLVADRPGPELSRPGSFHVLAIGARQPTEEHVESLGWWMTASAPIVVLLSLVGGYGLARHALRPIATLERAVTALDPSDLMRRLPVGDPPDELDRLALRFNELLGRLEQAQLRNRRFVRRAAHQLKTPLTVVLGEADLSLHDHLAPEAQGMRRVRAAAQQMRRRVDELLLLAQAQAGEHAPLDDLVELDGLALECADLMRGRAAQMCRSLTLGAVEAVTARGSDRLLREALVELIENACRHGLTEPDIRISVHADGLVAWIEVASGGPPIPDTLAQPDASPEEEGTHLGLTIVRWIAAQHGGELRYRHAGGLNLFGFSVPLTSALPSED